MRQVWGGYSVGEGEGESIDVVVQNKDVKFLRDLILENENEFCGYKVKITKAKGNVKVTDG